MTTETLTRKYTMEEYFALPDDGHKYELVDGELVEMAGASEEHVRVCSRLQFYLTSHVLPQDLGEVYGSDARYAVVPRTDNVRLADVSFVQTSRVTRGVKSMAFGPDLAVEVLSESNLYTDIEKKTKEYRNAGGQLVWVINTEDREVYIYRAGNLQRQTLTITDELDGENVLPGFKLPISKLFE